MINNCMGFLNRLERNNEVSLIWIPDHRGIPGSKTADQLTRKDTTMALRGPELSCGITEDPVKQESRACRRLRTSNQTKDDQGSTLYKNIH